MILKAIPIDTRICTVVHLSVFGSQIILINFVHNHGCSYYSGTLWHCLQLWHCMLYVNSSFQNIIMLCTKSKAGFSNWFCLFGRQTQVVDQGTTVLGFNWILHFEHCRIWTGHENLHFSRTLALNLVNCVESHPDHTCAERIKILFFLLCLPDSRTKLKNTPNRKLPICKDVIKDTNNKH